LIFIKEKKYKEIIDLINLSKFSESLNLLKNLENLYYNDVNFNNLIGFVYQNLNDFINANNYYVKSLKLDNENFETNFNIGILNYKKKDFKESERIFINLSKKFTENKDIFYNLGVIKYEIELYKEAIKYFKKALNLDDKFYFAQHHLAQCYEKLNNIDLAIENYKKAEFINLHKFNSTLNNLGNIFLKLKNYEQAEKYFLNALNCQGNRQTINNNLAVLYLEILDVDKAYYYLEKSINLDKNNVKIFSRLISTSLYLNKDINYYKKLSEEYGDIISHKIGKKYEDKNFLPKSKKIKLGFISADFREHPVGYYLLDFLPELKKFNFELYAYYNFPSEDHYTKSIKKNFNNWKNITLLNDKEVVKLIKEDEINVLIDMSGHSGDNRMPIFTYKPAPVQISWAAYLASTGVKEIDYIIGDIYSVPKKDFQNYTEKVLQLKNIWCCLSTSDIANIIPSSLPVLKNGYITFGCFNNPNKITENFINICSKILLNVENSKICFQSLQFVESINRIKILKLFEKNSVTSNRIIIGYETERIKLIKNYNNIDIALDTFPYNGGTTSFELSWMCVPLLTKKGDRFISKCGESINYNLNMKEWIADNDSEYIKKAIFFSRNIKELQEAKKKLIDYSRKSDLFNMNKFTKEFSENLINIYKSQQ
jgi:predicted O-linked N-acetylglucosamine transferase (SPINDLY family)